MPFILLLLVFSYYPLFGWVYAFFDYHPPKPLTLDAWVGLKWFKGMVDTPVKQKQIMRVMANTFGISGLNLLFSWFPMIFAVFFNEMKNLRYRKFIQTITTLPNFVSWVLVYSIAYALLNSNGAVNAVLLKTGLIEAPITFLQSSEHVWLSMFLWMTWKNAGWGAVMYLAAINGIDEQMMEAARVDGASKLRTIMHITVPSLLPTYFVLVMLSLANFLSNGMEQFFVFQNSFNKDSIQVLDLYVYNIAMGSGGYSLSTAISVLKSAVSVGLLALVNTASKKIRGEGFI
jgi:putative aldouronate transport system permease protein